MTGTSTNDAAAAFDRDTGFERLSETAFRGTTTPFDARVFLTAGDGRVRYEVVVRAPTLDAAVRGETVASVVHEGWFETFTLRIEDLGMAMRETPEPPSVTLDEAAEEVVVETAFETSAVAQAPEDARAAIQFVEGTYVEGIIPGYDYREPVAGLLERAAERSGGEGGPGGTPL